MLTHHVPTSKGQVPVIGKAYRTDLHLMRNVYPLSTNLKEKRTVYAIYRGHELLSLTIHISICATEMYVSLVLSIMHTFGPCCFTLPFRLRVHHNNVIYWITPWIPEFLGLQGIRCIGIQDPHFGYDSWQSPYTPKHVWWIAKIGYQWKIYYASYLGIWYS